MAEVYGSQHGEDMLMLAQFPDGFKGNVLEIGAWHPTCFSNSRKMIDLGWNAVLVEPTPLAVEKLLRAYAEHQNVKVFSGAVGTDRNGYQLFRMEVTEDAVSTSDPDTFELWKRTGGYYGKMWVKPVPISEIWDSFGHFDVVSIDAEGNSVAILRDMLWHISRSAFAEYPKVICVEFDNQKHGVREIASHSKYRIIMEADRDIGPVKANGTNMILVHE